MLRAAVCIEDELVIPADVGEWEPFRAWLHSERFPERGRIDWLQGTIEVDMSPEDLQTHGSLKGKLHAYIHRLVEEADLGQVFVDRARLSCAGTGLSCEPDVLFVSWESLRSGR